MLKCWRARRLFSDVLDGVATSKARAIVHAHLKKCPKCSRLFEQLKRVEILSRECLPVAPEVDWTHFEEETIEKTMDKLSRRGRFKERGQTG